MQTSTAIQCVNGKRVKTETITYGNGRQVKRIYDNVNDVIPVDLIIMNQGPVGRVELHEIEHPEVAQYKNHFKC